MSPSRAAVVSALVLLPLSALVFSAEAAGQDAGAHDTERARAHHAAGVDYFDRGRYADAAEQFREAHEISGRSHLLLNLSRALELAGELAPAADVLAEYLDAEPDASDRATLEDRIAALRERGASATPPEPEPEASSTEEPAPARPAPDLTGPIVLWASAGATLIAAIVTGSIALDLHASLVGTCGMDDLCPAGDASRIDTGAALTLTTDVLAGVTAGLVAGGLIWWAVEEAGSSSEQSALRPTLSCGATGCVASVQGRFR